MLTGRILIQFIAQIFAVHYLRKYRTDIERPFKAWLYPVPNAIAFFGMELYLSDVRMGVHFVWRAARSRQAWSHSGCGAGARDCRCFRRRSTHNAASITPINPNKPPRPLSQPLQAGGLGFLVGATVMHPRWLTPRLFCRIRLIVVRGQVGARLYDEHRLVLRSGRSCCLACRCPWRCQPSRSGSAWSSRCSRWERARARRSTSRFSGAISTIRATSPSRGRTSRRRLSPPISSR